MGKAPTQFCSKSIFVNFLQSLPAWTKMKSKFKQYAYCTLWPNLCWNYIRLANLKHEKLAQRENQTNFLKGGDSMIQIAIVSDHYGYYYSRCGDTTYINIKERNAQVDQQTYKYPSFSQSLQQINHKCANGLAHSLLRRCVFVFH